MKTIYLAGYTGRKPEALDLLAKMLDAVVVDIRMSPYSRVPHWNWYALRRLLGDRYLHVPEFGNKNYNNGGPILINDIEGGTRRLVEHAGDRFLLLCACAEPKSCHRTVVGVYLSAYGMNVSEVTKQQWFVACEDMFVPQGDQMSLFV